MSQTSEDLFKNIKKDLNHKECPKLEKYIKDYKKDIQHLKNMHKIELDNCKKEFKKSNINNNANSTAVNNLKRKIKKLEQEILILNNNKIEECQELVNNEKIKLAEYKSKLRGISGGGFINYLKKFENMIGNGMIGRARENFNQLYANEKEQYYELTNNINLNKKMKGGAGMMIIPAVIKMFLFTMGSFIFNWYPIMMLISFYCVYIEYKMLSLIEEDMTGTPLLFLAFAYCCPCFWTIYRSISGWNTNEGGSPDLFGVLSKCSADGLTLNYFKLKCKNKSCIVTSKDCFTELFSKNKQSLMNTVIKTAK